ncbi:MAG: hypothetical protein ACOCPM_06785 [Bacteroidales bacterium]
MKKPLLLIAIALGICLSTGIHAQKQTFESEGITFKITELKQTGRHLMLKMLVTSSDEDRIIQIRNKQAKVIDSANNVYTSVYKSRIGESIGNGTYGLASSRLDAGVAVKAYIIFKGHIAEKEKLNRIELPIDILDSQTTVKVNFQDLTVPYYASGNNFTNSNKHFEIADNVYFQITSVEKKASKVIVHFTLTNKDSDKPISPMVRDSYIIDSRGNSCACSEISLGDKFGGKYGNLRSIVKRGTSLNGFYVFKHPKIKNIKKIASIHFNIDKNSFKAKDIALTQE